MAINYKTHYDYERQAWVVNGHYERCGHESACDCYGRIHDSEPCQCEGCDTEPTTTEAGYVEQGYTLPDGWTWDLVHQKRERWNHRPIDVPLGGACGVTAWGVPIIADKYLSHPPR